HRKPGRAPGIQGEERDHMVDTAALAAHRPAHRVVLWFPGGVRYRLLARVLSAPHVTASADGPPQRRQVEFEDHHLLHGEDDTGRRRHFLRARARSPGPARAGVPGWGRFLQTRVRGPATRRAVP